MILPAMATQQSIAIFFKRKNEGAPLRESNKKPHVDSTPEKKTAPVSPSASKGMSPGSPAALRSELLKLCAVHKVLHPSMALGWYKALKTEFDKPYFKKLSEFVTAQRRQHTVFPRAEHVFSWAAGDVNDVKVVILGQDPYHGPGQAHGLCFSVQRGVAPPPSLVNMYKELESDVEGFRHPGHGCLLGWARQGVLLLNACLTVRSGQPNSHKDQGWEQFTDAVIKHISSNQKHVVFMLWGSYAQKKGSVVDKSRHHVLTSTHPSPLSAHRGFLGCKHFSKCNQLLIQNNRTPIDWNDLPPE
ncbi:uracil-DNA glycosylase-like isoform X2 [Amphibalanus amphitrite]|uniref:uracil-DNA glycosylase-like isoform X2 n=2 Tax=Amphibalanus amphitrite TaxID=1232801 RepID=UPI001C91BC95|nr:uracil-DNA glycosylase-like isoform X2 [Amphibalanus amphitrite]